MSTDSDYVIQPLEQIRPRLSQLVHSLSKLEESIRTLPIPKEINQIDSNKSQIVSIQNQISVIIQQLSSLAKTLNEWGPVLDSIIVYPNSGFDVVNNVNLLLTLLRKKLSPEVEKWIKDADSIARENTFMDINSLLDRDDEIVNEIFEYAQESINNFVFTGYLTTDELDKGLQVSDVMKLNNNNNATPHSADSSTGDLTQNDILRFIHQGVDSGIIS